MASASAAERSQADPSLRKYRGRQVVLVFSGQVCVCVCVCQTHLPESRLNANTLPPLCIWHEQHGKGKRVWRHLHF